MLEKVVNISGTKYVRVPADWKRQYNVQNFLDVRETDEGLLIRVPTKEQLNEVRKQAKEQLEKELW